MADLVRDCISEMTVNQLAQRIQSSNIRFDVQGFCEKINSSLKDLGLFERLDLIEENLINFLPNNFPEAARILVDSLGPELDNKEDDPIATDLSSSRGFIVVALCLYVSRNGKEHFEVSMDALKEMTKRFSSEGPIRDFIISHESQVLDLYEKWAIDPNVHVRRLVSESIRPRLPWACRLPSFIKDPEPVIALLEKLKNDKHLYVRRSVANNLNDISKDNPELVVSTLKKWSRDKSSQMTWLIKHALRTLIKAGDSEALELLGYSTDFHLHVNSFQLNKSNVNFGDTLEFTLELSTTEDKSQNLMIDYVIYHMKANGKLSPKVFKWTKKTITAKNPLSLTRKQAFKKINTRKYYEGRHEVHVQINGKVVAQKEFTLVM